MLRTSSLPVAGVLALATGVGLRPVNAAANEPALWSDTNRAPVPSLRAGVGQGCGANNVLQSTTQLINFERW